MRCPSCERETFRANRVGNLHFRPRGVPEGVLWAALLDGTCYSCRRVQKGQTKRESRREPIVRRKLTDTEIQSLNRDYQRYAANRRTRGVPREGLPVSTLERPGLFLMEVR